MSILQLDSFDGYVTSEIPVYWKDQAIFGAAGIGTPARTGVGALGPRPGGIARDIGVILSNAIIGAAFWSNSQGSFLFAFSQGIGGPFQCQLQMLADGTVGIQQRANGPIIGKSDPSGPVLQAGIYNYVEWRTSFMAGGGLNQVYINGQLVLNAVLDTQGALDPGASTVWLQGIGGGSQNFFDDYYLVNPDDASGLIGFAGDSSVVCSISSANGDINQWTPSPLINQNWQNVHEIPSSNGLHYNRSNGVSTVDDYAVSPLLALTDNILAVQLTHVTFAEEGGDIAEPYMTIQGTPFNDDAHVYEPNTAVYTPTMFIYERNPLGSGLNPWTGASFNGTNWGIGHRAHPVKFFVRLSAEHGANQGAVVGVLTP